jgi:hypothetical protein
LRHQIAVLERRLGKQRLRFTPGDRAFLVALLHRLPRHVLRRLRLLVRPDTVLRWHRDLVARHHASATGYDLGFSVRRADTAWDRQDAVRGSTRLHGASWRSVAKHQNLGFLGDVRAQEQSKGAEEPDEDQIDQSQGHAHGSCQSHARFAR